MLKKLDIKSFYSEENKHIDSGMGIGGIGLLTPNQFINVYNYSVNDIDGLGTHEGTNLILLNEIYGLGIDNSIKGYPNKSKVLEKIPHGVNNFVQVQYITQASLDFVTILIPLVITKYQYEELEKFNEEIKNSNLLLEVKITNYNPLKLRFENIKEGYYSQENALEEALQYMTYNKRVVDYELPFGEERIIKYNLLD